MFTFKNPVKICVGLGATACVVSSLSMYFRYRVEERIGNQVLCKNCVQDLLQHKPSLEILGEPVTWRRPNIMDPYNHITVTKANVSLPVTGSKTKGQLLIEAIREETDPGWTLASLKLKTAEDETIIRELITLVPDFKELHK